MRHAVITRLLLTLLGAVVLTSGYVVAGPDGVLIALVAWFCGGLQADVLAQLNRSG